jgi:hypothetical protein
MIWKQFDRMGGKGKLSAPMKVRMLLGVIAVVAVSGCEDFNRPITAGDFDPLGSPGNTRSSLNAANGFRGGQFVRAIMGNTAFYKNRPKGDADADKLLPIGTSMKVINQTDNYVKVELDSGEIGFVPAIMVEDPNQVPDMSMYGNPNEFQVYPPMEGFEALPQVPQGEMPPAGSIPTVIDPGAPASGVPNPRVDVLPQLPPAQQTPPVPETPPAQQTPPPQKSVE